MTDPGEETTAYTEDELGRLWAAALEQADRELGTDCVAQWIRPVRLTSIDNDLAVLSASTGFLADWVERNYGLHLLRILQSLSPGPPPEQWPEPLDEAAFHGLAGEFVRMVEPHTEADPNALLVQVLVSYGNAIGAMGPSWT